jgi:hypothetical protein
MFRSGGGRGFCSVNFEHLHPHEYRGEVGGKTDKNFFTAYDTAEVTCNTSYCRKVKNNCTILALFRICRHQNVGFIKILLRYTKNG